MRQCEPCEPPSVPEHESALEKARRENAARRDLLLVLGFDDETQQHFVQSAAQRQIVYALLQGDNHVDGQLAATAATTPLAPLAQIEARSARATADLADLELGTGQVMDSINPNIAMTDVAMNQQPDVLDPTVSLPT